MILYENIKAIAGAEGIDFFGIADLSIAQGAIADQGGDDIARFPRAVSIGITLVHQKVGPRARWASVLTDAELTPTGSLQESRCGECRACVDICPVQAFTGKHFIPADSRDERFAAHQCNEYMRSIKEKIGHRICGLCLKACPYGKKGVAEQII